MKSLFWSICYFCVLLITVSSEGHQLIGKNLIKLFEPISKSSGPCRYFRLPKKQSNQCRKDPGLPDQIKEARRLTIKYCEEQFRYDRWNCSIQTRGKGNVFNKVYRETAFVHAIFTAAMTYTISRACAAGKLTRCGCTTDNKVLKRWRGYRCGDNLRHGRTATRSFLKLNSVNGDIIDEVLKHDSEIGIKAVQSSLTKKCICHGVSGSCSIKTCWRRIGDFSKITSILREKYHRAIKQSSNNRASRRNIGKKKETSLLFLDKSPTFCYVTHGRQCLHPENCATLCCGRGYIRKYEPKVERCHCSIRSGTCCDVVCNFCNVLVETFYCK